MSDQVILTLEELLIYSRGLVTLTERLTLNEITEEEYSERVASLIQLTLALNNNVKQKIKNIKRAHRRGVRGLLTRIAEATAYIRVVTNGASTENAQSRVKYV